MLHTLQSVPKNDGFDLVESLFDPLTINALRDEAYALMPSAIDGIIKEDDANEWRGGAPSRSFQSAPGGSLQTMLLHSTGMTQFLKEWSGLDLKPTLGGGTYSYYMREGDHLALHRDIESCEFVVITCLDVAGKQDESSGALCIYPTRIYEPLTAIRANPAVGAMPIHLQIGQTMIMRGGVIPHALLPLSAGQFRIVSILCYHL